MIFVVKGLKIWLKACPKTSLMCDTEGVYDESGGNKDSFGLKRHQAI